MSASAEQKGKKEIIKKQREGKKGKQQRKGSPRLALLKPAARWVPRVGAGPGSGAAQPPGAPRAAGPIPKALRFVGEAAAVLGPA